MPTPITIKAHAITITKNAKGFTVDSTVKVPHGGSTDLVHCGLQVTIDPVTQEHMTECVGTCGNCNLEEAVLGDATTYYCTCATPRP